MPAEPSPTAIYEGHPHGPVGMPNSVVTITLDGKPMAARDVALRLDNYLQLELKWHSVLEPGPDKITKDLFVTFEGGTTAEFLMSSHQMHSGGHEEFVATSRISPLDLAGKSKGSATALILNGPRLHPKAAPTVLQYENHEVSLVPFEHFRAMDSRNERLPLQPTISHAATLRTLNGKPFRATRLYDFLGRVCGFLGFIKGTRVGYGQVRNDARDGFRCLGFTKADRLHSLPGWYHWNLEDKLPELFQNYMDLMSTAEARRSLGRALAYYKISNVTRYDAVETAVIMSVAGLETLAGHVLGTAGGWTPNMIRNITLAEQVRACSRLLGIRGDPAEQSALLAKRLRPTKGQPQGRDGFSLITEFRNGVTHPGPFNYDVDIYDAWNASQWLLEMQLLVLMSYRGRYQDRRLNRRSFVGNLSTIPVGT